MTFPVSCQVWPADGVTVVRAFTLDNPLDPTQRVGPNAQRARPAGAGDDGDLVVELLDYCGLGFARGFLEDGLDQPGLRLI